MGTTNAYGGPTGTNPLIPPWTLDDEEDNGAADEDTPDATPWAIPKRRLTSLAKSGEGPRDEGYGKVAGGFVQSLGGSRTAASTSTAGRRAAGSLANFLSLASSRGIGDAARAFHLEAYIGENVSVLLAAAARELAPTGQLHEDSVARTAMIQTLSELFEGRAVEEEGVETLGELSRNDIEDIISTYIGNYIAQRLLSNLFDRIEENAPSDTEAYRIEQDLMDFVRRSVNLRLQNINVMEIDWSGERGQEVIDDLFERGYAVLEALA